MIFLYIKAAFLHIKWVLMLQFVVYMRGVAYTKYNIVLLVNIDDY